jgi:hypothetical protein
MSAEPREVDEIQQLQKLGPLFARMFKCFDPREFVQRLSMFDRGLYNAYFRGFRTEKFNRPKLIEIANREVFDRKNRVMAMFVTTLWNREHRDLYNDMLGEVKKINEDVEAIEVITDEQGPAVLTEVLKKGHEPEDVLICVRINDVRFTEAFILGNLPDPATANI